MPCQNHEVQRIMKDCRMFRTHNCTSYLELEMYFEFMYQTILQKDNLFNCNSKQTSKQIFHRLFFKAYQHLSQLEAAKYYQHMLNVVHQYVNCTKSKSSHVSLVQNHQPKSKLFQVDIIKKGFFNNTQNIHYLQLDRKKSILLIKSPNNPYDLQINIENYFVRQSGGNEKGKTRKQFLIVKAGGQSTPDEIRFAMKDVYQFPVFYSELWNFVLHVHSKKLKQIIDKLSDGGSKKGYVEIVFLDSQNLLQTQESQRKSLKLNQQQSVQEYQYLDTNHPVSRVSQQFFTKLGEKEQHLEGHFLWGKQWQKTSKGHLKNFNLEYISVQRGAVKKVIKSFMSMGNGQSQMPIQMFSNESNLLQLARSCKFFEYFFDRKKTNCHQRQAVITDGFTKAFCAIVGFLLIRNSMQKPIQPFLGETYQGFIDGYPVNAQQIGKNQSYILFETNQIKLFGCLQLKTGISGVNSILAGSKGYLTLELINLKKTPKILFTLPMIQLSGLLYGDRLVQISDTSVIYEQDSGIFCLINWGKNKKVAKISKDICEKQDFVRGEIVKLKQGKKFEITKYMQNKGYIKQFCKQKSIQKVYGQIYGNWTTQLFYRVEGTEQNAAKSLYKVDSQKPGDLYHYIQPLPSDCRSRKDIRLLQCDKITQAQVQRKKVQQIQTKQQKMRLILKKT